MSALETTPATLRLTGRRGSHFTRVAMIFAHELALPVALDPVSDLRSLDPNDYGGHPALKLPTLHVDGAVTWGTDDICRKLAALAGRASDPRVVLSEHVTSERARNAQELVWHCMRVQVELVIGVMFGKLPADNLLFVKARTGMLGALAWLDANIDAALADLPPERQVSVLETTLFCLLEHIAFRPTVTLGPLPRLRAVTGAFGERASALATPWQG